MLKNNSQIKPKICPTCGITYTNPSAISRKDNITPICPICGTKEALCAMGIEKDEQDKILDTIEKYGIYSLN